MELTFQPVILRTTVGVPCRLITSVEKINPAIISALKKCYEGRIYTQDGYVKPNSVNLLTRGPGYRGNSDQTGEFLFDVKLNCLVCRPAIGERVICKVESVNQSGLLCTKIPYIILIPRNSETIDRIQGINPGQWIEVVIKEFQIDSSKRYGQIFLIVAGLPDGRILVNPKDFMNLSDTKVHVSPLPNSSRLTLSIGKMPILEPLDQTLIDLEDQVHKMGELYEKYLRPWNNDYEFLRPGEYNRRGAGVPNIQGVDRTYFKYWEILHHFGIALQGRAINVLHLDVGRGGSAQAVAIKRRGATDHHIIYGSEPILEKPFRNLEEIQLDMIEGDLIQSDLNQVATTIVSKLSTKVSDRHLMDLIIGGNETRLHDHNPPQDLQMAQLIIHETYVALSTQRPGGSLVLRIHDLRFPIYKHLIQLLSQFYTDLSLYKPSSSRMESGERYLVCVGFSLHQDLEQRLGELSEILTRWRQLNLADDQYVLGLSDDVPTSELDEYHQSFVLQQIAVLNRALGLAKQSSTYQEEAQRDRKQEQIRMAQGWCRRFQHEVNEETEVRLFQIPASLQPET